MSEPQTAKLKITVGAAQVEYEGSETLLQTGLPKWTRAADSLRAAGIVGPLNQLVGHLDDAHASEAALRQIVEAMKSDLDSMSEMGEMESLRLQMYMDRINKALTVLSNILKKTSQTAESITQNLK